MKQCIKCEKNYSIYSFNKDKQNKDGRSNTCKYCVKEYQKTHRKKITAKSKEWKEKTKNEQKKITAKMVELIQARKKLCNEFGIVYQHEYIQDTFKKHLKHFKKNQIHLYSDKKKKSLPRGGGTEGCSCEKKPTGHHYKLKRPRNTKVLTKYNPRI